MLRGPLSHCYLVPLLADRFDLVVLHQRVRQELLAELAEAVGVVGLELDESPDPHLAHALEAERGQGSLDGLALRIEDALLGADQDARLHRTRVPASSTYPAASRASPRSSRPRSSPHLGSSPASTDSGSRTFARAHSRTAPGASRPST